MSSSFSWSWCFCCLRRFICSLSVSSSISNTPHITLQNHTTHKHTRAEIRSVFVLPADVWLLIKFSCVLQLELQKQPVPSADQHFQLQTHKTSTRTVYTHTTAQTSVDTYWSVHFLSILWNNNRLIKSINKTKGTMGIMLSVTTFFFRVKLKRFDHHQWSHFLKFPSVLCSYWLLSPHYSVKIIHFKNIFYEFKC